MDGEYQPKCDGDEGSDDEEGDVPEDWEAERDPGGPGEKVEEKRSKKRDSKGPSSHYNKDISMLHRRSLVKEV